MKSELQIKGFVVKGVTVNWEFWDTWMHVIP